MPCVCVHVKRFHRPLQANFVCAVHASAVQLAVRNISAVDQACQSVLRACPTRVLSLANARDWCSMPGQMFRSAGCQSPSVHMITSLACMHSPLQAQPPPRPHLPILILLTLANVAAGTSYAEFIRMAHLPAQLAQVDPIVASFCGGAVGVLSTLMLVEANNSKMQAANRCIYCGVRAWLAVRYEVVCGAFALVAAVQNAHALG